ncbi:MAG TPA: DUF2147 domain-containing protein [Sphingobium sp.]|uniref:DUF2147 domain-containing protein n=1 Tax=Sphingobium sp. TaxID=1912891 RepID=UPI002ED32902
MMRLTGLTAAAVLMFWGSVAFGHSPLGDWLTDDRSAIIHVAPCGQKLCGTIQHVLDPKAPAKDVNNPDSAKRARPLVGVSVLSGFTRSGEGWDGGIAYDPKAGKSYKSRLAMSNPQTLDVTGCILFLCRTRHWTRAEGSETALR